MTDMTSLANTSADTPTFLITIELTYRPYRIPPRCRNARQVPDTELRYVRIPIVTLEQAPVAVRIPSQRYSEVEDSSQDVVLRAWNGNLLEPLFEKRWDDNSPVVIAGSDLSCCGDFGQRI
ncbi:hypothetical protein ACX80Z_15960 [Arthrobacter sp. TMT4-20]